MVVSPMGLDEGWLVMVMVMVKCDGNGNGKGKGNGMDRMDEAMMKHFTCTSQTHEYRSDGHCM